MKKLFLVLLVITSLLTFAQNERTNFLKQKLATAKNDSNKVWILEELTANYAYSFADTGIMYALQGVQLAERLNYKRGEAWCMNYLTDALITMGSYSVALKYGFKSLSIFSELKDTPAIIKANGSLGLCYRDQGDYQQALFFFKAARKYLSESKSNYEKLAERDSSTFGHSRGQLKYDSKKAVAVFDIMIASAYEKSKHLDSALFYMQRGYRMLSQNDFDESGIPSTYMNIMASIYAKTNQDSIALYFYKQAIISAKYYIETDIVDAYNGIADVYFKKGKNDSAIYYAKKALIQQGGRTYPLGLMNASTLLANAYETQNKTDSALKYLRLTTVLKDSLFNQEKTRAAQSVAFNEQFHEQELTNERKELLYKQQLQNEALIKKVLIGGVVVLLLLAFIIFRNIALKRKMLENKIILEQKKQNS